MATLSQTIWTDAASQHAMKRSEEHQRAVERSAFGMIAAGHVPRVPGKPGP